MTQLNDDLSPNEIMNEVSKLLNKLPQDKKVIYSHSDDKKELVRAMVNSGSSYSQIERATGVSKGSISAWMKVKPLNDREIELSKHLQEQTRAKLILNAHRSMDAITNEDLEKASGKDKAIMTGIFTDKIIRMDEVANSSPESDSRDLIEVRARRVDTSNSREEIKKQIQKIRDSQR